MGRAIWACLALIAPQLSATDLPVCQPQIVAPSAFQQEAIAAREFWTRMISGMDDARRAKLCNRVTIRLLTPVETPLEATEGILRERLQGEHLQEKLAVIRTAFAKRIADGGLGRVPDRPRGYSTIVKGMSFAFVGVENLAEKSEWDQNGSRKFRSLVHEMGHVIFSVALSSEEQDSISKINRDRADPAKYPDPSVLDGDEFFAECTEAWFGLHQRAIRQAGLDGEWIKTNIPRMGALLEKVYGPPRSLRLQGAS